MINQREFGKRVAKKREERRLSVQDLAERTGLSYQTLWRIERGVQGDPGGSTVQVLARELGVSMDYLAGLYAETEHFEGTTETLQEREETTICCTKG